MYVYTYALGVQILTFKLNGVNSNLSIDYTLVYYSFSFIIMHQLSRTLSMYVYTNVLYASMRICVTRLQ
jgi:hypothetical protein